MSSDGTKRDDENEGNDGSIFRRHAAYVGSDGTRRLLL